MHTHISSTPSVPTHLRRTRAVATHAPQRVGVDRLAMVAIALAGALGLAAVSSSVVVAGDWQLQRVDEGTKPALALTPDGQPVMVYMLERQDGWVRIAVLEAGGWQIDQVADGYFYGPPDIAAGPDGVIHAAYHDHQDSQFQPDKGDAVHVSGGAGDWTTTTAADDGHDGWDNRITVDADGRPHMVGVDPEDFGGVDGIEYYSLDAQGEWQAEPVGSGPQTYRWGASVAVDPAGVPWVSYYDGATAALMLAGRGTEGWQVETVDDDADTGLYSELVIDPEGGQHISYLERLGETEGTVKYAFREGPQGEWDISAVDDLGALFIGFTGARNLTSVALAPDSSPWVAYSDEQVMSLAHLVDGDWQIETVTEAGEAPLGQIVSLEIDAQDRPHVAFAEVTDKSQLDGSVWYATRD